LGSSIPRARDRIDVATFNVGTLNDRATLKRPAAIVHYLIPEL